MRALRPERRPRPIHWSEQNIERPRRDWKNTLFNLACLAVLIASTAFAYLAVSR